MRTEKEIRENITWLQENANRCQKEADETENVEAKGLLIRARNRYLEKASVLQWVLNEE
jgi:hypothetical protein